ncbi:MAG: hypothetical protein A4E25_00284 [Methanobacterium sp. PtaB.Bin024]|nr:MAG: hypothetical protein A4E25_00284 [Methanobacterium sp. PtaB.Bin024]OPY24806.1 MAG: hypothetical protein A4E27_01148 [Methanobacterium sp. PtaU1.Bin242]
MKKEFETVKLPEPDPVYITPPELVALLFSKEELYTLNFPLLAIAPPLPVILPFIKVMLIKFTVEVLPILISQLVFPPSMNVLLIPAPIKVKDPPEV